jgi:nuclear GTP-binding protein
MARTMGKKRIGGSSDNPNRAKKEGAGASSQRDKATINRLLMYRGGKPVRNKDGKITGGEFMQRDKAGGKDTDATTGRVAPDRRWFGNTRVVSAPQLDRFREVMAAKAADPYSMVLHSKALPMGLLVDTKVQARAHLLSAESFQDTFGKRAQRKRPRLAAADLGELASASASKASTYDLAVEGGAPIMGGAGGEANPNPKRAGLSGNNLVRDAILNKGTSKRIWGELYRVLDCACPGVGRLQLPCAQCACSISATLRTSHFSLQHTRAHAHAHAHAHTCPHPLARL